MKTNKIIYLTALLAVINITHAESAMDEFTAQSQQKWNSEQAQLNQQEAQSKQDFNNAYNQLNQSIQADKQQDLIEEKTQVIQQGLNRIQQNQLLFNSK